MKKTYCFISAQFLPTRGGVERYTQSLGRELIARGNRVMVLTSFRRGLQQHEFVDGIEVLRIPSLQLMAGRFPIPFSFSALYKAEQWIAKNKVDLLVLQTHFYALSLWGAQIGKKLGLKTIGIDHCTGYMLDQGIAGWFGIQYEKFCVNRLEQIPYYGVSGACCTWMKKLGLKATGIIYNAVDPKQIQLAVKADTSDWKTVLGLPTEAQIVLYAGRLVPEKGILLLLEAFKKIKRKFNNVVLVIMGDGPIYGQVCQQKSAHVRVLGSQPFENVLSMMGQADVFCLPTYYPEGMPTSVLEAVAVKCCVITTEAGGSKELLQNKINGIVLGELTSTTLEKALTFVLEEDKWRKGAVQKAYDALVKNFTWGIACSKLEQIEGETLYGQN